MDYFVRLKEGVPQNKRMRSDNWMEFSEIIYNDGSQECPEGFLPVRKVLPRPEPTGSQMLAWTYTPVNGEMVKEYYLERRYSVYKLILALKNIEVEVDGETTSALAPAIEWVKSHGLYEEFVTIGEIRDDDEDLMGAIAALGAEFGLSDGDVAAILEECEV